MKKSNKFSPEVRERAVRLVQEHRGQYPSLWAAVEQLPQRLAAYRKRCWIGSSVSKSIRVRAMAW